jgi:IS30 family transposase
MKIAKAKGRLPGKQPKLKPNQAKQLLELHDLGTYTQAELAELFGVGRSTVYRTIERMRPKPPELERPFAHPAHPQAYQERRPRSPRLVSSTRSHCRVTANDVSAAEAVAGRCVA